ncbi:hypothetical protein ABVT39_016840 [Epinephelus coioides]
MFIIWRDPEEGQRAHQADQRHPDISGSHHVHQYDAKSGEILKKAKEHTKQINDIQTSVDLTMFISTMLSKADLVHTTAEKELWHLFYTIRSSRSAARTQDQTGIQKGPIIAAGECRNQWGSRTTVQPTITPSNQLQVVFSSSFGHFVVYCSGEILKKAKEHTKQINDIQTSVDLTMFISTMLSKADLVHTTAEKELWHLFYTTRSSRSAARTQDQTGIQKGPIIAAGECRNQWGSRTTVQPTITPSNQLQVVFSSSFGHFVQFTALCSTLTKLL